MAVASDGATRAGTPRRRSREPRSDSGRSVRAAVVAVGFGLAYVVGRDGSPGWQVARVAAVAGLAALTLAALERRGRAGRAGISFVSGLLGVSVGVGIGLPHAAKTGLSAVTAAGLAVLAGGLVLLVAGSVVLTRTAGGWRRAAVVPGLVLATFVGIWSIGQAVGATNVPRTAVGSTTPADFDLRYRDVELSTSDGVTLSGWYVPSTNGAAVVLLHGAGSTRSGVLDHAVVLARNGYGVLLFDARGHGRSGGRAMDFGWYGDEDTAAAVDFLASQGDVDDGRIAAVGMSMGGEEAIGAAAADDRISAVVAEGVTNRVAGDKGWLSDSYGWRGAFQERIEHLVYGIADLLTAADPPITLREAVAAAAPRPVLLIAASEENDEEPAGRYIRAGSPDTVELWVVAGAGHTGGLDTEPAEWEARVTAFLGAALTDGGGS